MLNKKLILTKEEDLKAYNYYLALAKSVASKYGDKSEYLVASLMGLAKAFYKFTPTDKYKFSTYATYFMKEEVENYDDNSAMRK